jgi:hypothetical protein
MLLVPRQLQRVGMTGHVPYYGVSSTPLPRGLLQMRYRSVAPRLSHSSSTSGPLR